MLRGREDVADDLGVWGGKGVAAGHEGVFAAGAEGVAAVTEGVAAGAEGVAAVTEGVADVVFTDERRRAADWRARCERAIAVSISAFRVRNMI